jgi:hypothetical protein
MPELLETSRCGRSCGAFLDDHGAGRRRWRPRPHPRLGTANVTGFHHLTSTCEGVVTDAGHARLREPVHLRRLAVPEGAARSPYLPIVQWRSGSAPWRADGG